jgi:hypothetical protein
VAGAFVSLNGITRYLKCLYSVLNAVLHLSPSLIRIYIYIPLANQDIFTIALLLVDPKAVRSMVEGIDSL